MAKSKQQEPALRTVVSTNYRVERKSTFAWQAIRVTLFSDGSLNEESCIKEDMIEIVIRKLSKIMREEGQVDFLKAKAEKARAEEAKTQ